MATGRHDTAGKGHGDHAEHGADTGTFGRCRIPQLRGFDLASVSSTSAPTVPGLPASWASLARTRAATSSSSGVREERDDKLLAADRLDQRTNSPHTPLDADLRSSASVIAVRIASIALYPGWDLTPTPRGA